MANPIRRLVQLVFDRNAAQKTEQEAKQSLDQVDSRLGRIRQTAVKVGQALAAAWALNRAKDLTRELFRLGTSVEETGSKFTSVFGSEVAGTLDAFISDWGTVAGLTIREGRDMAATAGAIAQGMGFARDESAQFATTILQAAGDLQSFHNVPIGETFNALRSGITGETEPLKRFGIVLRADEVNARALADSTKTVASELTQQELAAARATLILEKMGVASGDLDRTQNSTANTARRLQTIIRQMVEDFATSLLPVFSLIVQGWGDATDGMTVFGRAAQSFGSFLSRLVQGIQVGAVRLNALLRSIPARFRVFLANEIDAVGNWVETVENGVNRLRALVGADAVDWTSGLRESAARLREEGERDLVAFEALVQQEIEKIRQAADVQIGGGGAGVDIPLPNIGGNEETMSDAAKKALEQLESEADRITESMRTPLEVYRDSIASIRAHRDADRISQETYTRAVANAREEYFKAKEALKEEEEELSKVDQALVDHQTNLEATRTVASFLGDEINLLEEEQNSLIATMRVLAEEGVPVQDERFQALAQRLADVRAGLRLTSSEMEQTAAIATTAGELVGAAFGSGIGPLAEGKAKQNAVLAAEELAHGFAALLNPFTAATASGHFAAAAKYSAVAVAWKALAGSAGGGSAVGGGGRTTPGSVGASSDLGGRSSEGLAPVDTEVHIHFVGEGFQAVNPEVQRVVRGASQLAEERYGPNTRVRVHSTGS